MFDLERIIRPNIKKLQPYSSARDEFKELTKDMVFLDANENPFETGFNRYPDPQQTGVKQLLAMQKGVKTDNVLLGNGSDEVLDLIFRAFCQPEKDSVITLPPTYGMYKVLAAINTIKNIEIPLKPSFQLDYNSIKKRFAPTTKIVFICSPNNPTANSFNVEIIKKILCNFDGIVVIDEAYIDFSTQKSWVTQLADFPNLIVTQTLSKAYGLAGIRLGICYASKEIITVLNRIKPPYNINILTQQKAVEVLSNQHKTSLEIEQLVNERQQLTEILKNIKIIKKVYPSDTNFILVKVDDAVKRYYQLIKKGIVVRNRSNQILCDNCLRFTVGTPKENKKLIKILSEL